ncbi:MAG TPA: globin [Phenylobacterium sp.]|nr:globin [Phenylobacterium sp.]
MSDTIHDPDRAPGHPAAHDPADADLIVESLERAGELCGDLTPRVYARLFREQPGMEALFGADTGDQVKGEMLARVIQAILDFLGEQHYAATLIRSEVINHEGFQVPAAVFGTFFATIAATLEEVLGEAWTPQTAAAWRRLLSDLDAYVSLPAPAASGTA